MNETAAFQTLYILGGTIADGTGAPAFRGDLALRGDTILSVRTSLSPPRGASRLDAEGLVIAPGFIDIHSHTDETLLLRPLAESKIAQGVTTEIGGNCGSSVAPLSAQSRALLQEALETSGQACDWHDFSGFFDRLEGNGIGPNFASLVGHGNLRSLAVGLDDRAASAAEIDAMKSHLTAALRAGALGLSLGLIYPPGCYADTEELTALISALPPHSFFAVHMRDEGAAVVEALQEVLGIAERTGVPLQVSHHKVSGRQHWPLLAKCIDLIENARARGLDVTADLYPYTATHTSLSAVLPHWMKSGGRASMLQRLQDPDALLRCENEWGERASQPEAWQEYLISRTFDVENRPLQGQRISEACRLSAEKPLAVIARLLVKDGGRTEMMRFSISENNIAALLEKPWVMIGSDAAARDFKQDWPSAHPRAFGTFPRVLARYVTERPLLPLEEAVRRMTSLPARRAGLADRGKIVPGYKADLVLLDFDNLRDKADFASPAQRPQGIRHVLVNGVFIVKDGEFTGLHGGKVLKKLPKIE